MPARGDITADEVYADREMLNRLGYGIMDVAFGSAGIGSENIHKFTYLVTPDTDPRFYRRKVYDLTGHYYPNDLAKAIWDKLIDHKWVLSERDGAEVDLKTAATDWLENHSHTFLKEWTFHKAEIPLRIRNRREIKRGLLELAFSRLVPRSGALFDAGFSIVDVSKAAVVEALLPGIWKKVPVKKQAKEKAEKRHIGAFFLQSKNKPKKSAESEREHYLKLEKISDEDIKEGRYYVQIVANLTGHEPGSEDEAKRRWHELLEHKWYMSERAGYDVGMAEAAVDYFRRLNLLRETETGYEA